MRHARPAAEIAKLDKRYRLPQCGAKGGSIGFNPGGSQHVNIRTDGAHLSVPLR